MIFSSRLASTLLLALVAGCAACSVQPPEVVEAPSSEVASEAAPAPPPEDLATAELSTVGWDGISGTPVVLLRELASGQVLPIWIGMAEARAIALELHGVEPPRPMTHDLMASLLGELDATLEEVVVSELRESTYYGLLKLRVAGEDEPRWVDTRPSDGLALALRTGATIRVARKLLEEQPDFQFLAPESSDQVVRVLGLTVTAVTAELREEHGLPERDGIFVAAATGKAARVGLARGDLIVAIDGEVPEEPLDLLEAIREAPITGVVEITYWRDGEERTAELPLEITRPPARKKSDTVASLESRPRALPWAAVSYPSGVGLAPPASSL